VAKLFVLASSLSLAQALASGGAAAWLADLLVRTTPAAAQHPLLIAAMLLLTAAPVRLLVPTITRFLAITMPIAMSVGAATSVGLRSFASASGGHWWPTWWWWW
jgi:hypothetical protein